MMSVNAAPRRPGPVPLVLHMAMARSQYASAQAALAGLLRPPEDGQSAMEKAGPMAKWRAQHGDVPPAQLSAALAEHCQERLALLISGIERYQTDAFARPHSKAQTVLHIHAASLQDHGGAGPPVLLVPSLINPGWVLDLLPGVSFAQHLVQQGFHVYSMDWGRPRAKERRFTLSDYVEKRLVAALEYIQFQNGPCHLIGYCLGGNIALAGALIRPDLVTSFCAIATPWDFSAMGASARNIVSATYQQLRPILAKTGEMPADALQALFAQLDPTQIERKFVKFAALDPQDPGQRKKIDHFIAVEDWSNEGPPLASGVVEDCFVKFYGANDAYEGAWRVAGEPVRPGQLACPALVLAAGKDKIVPQASTLALAHQLPAPQVLTPHAGHVGMMVGQRAQALCWQPVSAWLASQPAAG